MIRLPHDREPQMLHVTVSSVTDGTDPSQGTYLLKMLALFELPRTRTGLAR